MAGLIPTSGPRESASGSPLAAKGLTPPGRRDLTAFRDTMYRAQETVMVERRAPADQGRLRTARVAQLQAMCEYERALTSCSLPIPQRLHQDALLLRRLLA